MCLAAPAAAPTASGPTADAGSIPPAELNDVKNTVDMEIQAFDGTFVSSRVLSSSKTYNATGPTWYMSVEVTNSTGKQVWDAAVFWKNDTKEYVVYSLNIDGQPPLGDVNRE